MRQVTDVPAEWARRAPVRLGEVESTQIEARRLAAAGASEGTVVLAEHQTQGRGRFGRTWVDEPGSALLVSIILHPGLSVSRLPQLSLVAGVAAAEAVGIESRLPVELSWPNDLMVRGRKVAGVLAESFVSGAGSHVVVLGIGINVNQTGFPEPLAARATSLALEGGHRFDREGLLQALLGRLEAWYRRWLTDGFGPIREAWCRSSTTLGQRIVGPDGVGGTAVDLDEDGALLMRTDSGALLRQVAGEPLQAQA